MDIDKRDRTELKAYFVKNAIPTEGNFAELIDGALNQKDDGIVKLPGDPLSIQAAGDAASQKTAINFYDSFTDADPAWVLSLNPRSDPGDPATARAGFNISDGAGQSRLFIDRTTGDLGVTGSLDVGGDLTVTGAGKVAGRDVATDGAALDAHSADTENPHNVTAAQAGALPTSGGVVAQENWHSAGLHHWSNYGAGDSTAAYFKDSMGIVHLKGTVTGGGYGQPIFTLQPSYRPSVRLFFAALTGVTSQRAVPIELRIYPDGSVIPFECKPGETVTPVWISLEGITFRPA